MKKAEKTRLYILEKAFDLIYENGYQATSIDNIIEKTDVTKGAFYYHFKTKEEMGLAMIDEVIRPRFVSNLITPIKGFSDPVTGIYETIKTFMMEVSETQLRNGCPTNNLIQEMAPINTKFKEALRSILDLWQQEIVGVLSEAAKQDRIKNQNFQPVAAFIVASYEGTRGLGKLHNSYAYYQNYLGQLKAYLGSL